MGASIVARDVSARRVAEESLRRSEATSRALLASVTESIVVTDAAGRIVLVNARAEAMFGYTQAELIGQPVEALIPAPLRERHVAHRGTYMAAPRIRSMGRGLDLAALKKDGTEFPVEVSLSYVETDEGVRAIAFVTDISERVAFQKAARQADKLAALGTLSAGIAHEINNPIGIITSRVEVMMLEADEVGLPDEVRKDLEVILRHARRVATITQGLLSFARQSSGTRGPVNLNQVTEEIVQLVRKDMSRARVQVTTKLDETMPTIVADANAIGQVLLNLLTNARGSMPEGGEITIETSHLAAARSVRLAVRDTGSGIPAEPPAEDLRSVLHHEAGRDRARSVDQPRHRARSPRDAGRPLRGRQGQHVHADLPGRQPRGADLAAQPSVSRGSSLRSRRRALARNSRLTASQIASAASGTAITRGQSSATSPSARSATPAAAHDPGLGRAQHAAARHGGPHRAADAHRARRGPPRAARPPPGKPGRLRGAHDARASA